MPDSSYYTLANQITVTVQLIEGSTLHEDWRLIKAALEKVIGQPVQNFTFRWA